MQVSVSERHESKKWDEDDDDDDYYYLTNVVYGPDDCFPIIS